MENKAGLREKVLNVLCAVNDEIRDNQDQDLLVYGIISSFDIVPMMMELEDAFGIEIEAKHIVPDNFRTVDSVVALVEHILESFHEKPDQNS